MRVSMVVFGDLRSDFRVYREAAALRSAGWEVSLVAGARRTDLPPQWDGFRLHLLPVPATTSLRRAYPRFWRWAHRQLSELPTDVIHAHDLDALWPAAAAARDLGVPLVYDSHELWVEQSSLVSRPLVRGFWSVLERRLIRRARRVVAVSPAIARQLEQRYGLAAVTVLRNVPPQRPRVASQRLRQALGLPAAEPLFLYQGGFLTDNGLPQQVAAMARVEGAHLVLLGDGPTEPALRAQVDAARLGSRVHFLPRVPFAELHEYTCSADVGLCLIRPAGRSFYWSLPNKLFEYLMAGLPVLGGDTPEIRAVLEATGAGLTVDAADPNAIARAFIALRDDAALRQRLGAAALAAAPDYCWEREAPVLLDLYARL
ncbi:MAG: glycosyltransferase family 4 protein [Gemmatimonadota bacterium]